MTQLPWGPIKSLSQSKWPFLPTNTRNLQSPLLSSPGCLLTAFIHSIKKAVMGSGSGTFVPAVTAALVNSASCHRLIWWGALLCQGVITKTAAWAEFNKYMFLKANSDYGTYSLAAKPFRVATYSIFKFHHCLARILQGFRLLLKAGLPTYLSNGRGNWDILLDLN